MRVLLPTKEQETAIRTALMSRIGPAEYRALFRIFLCGEICRGVVHVYVLNEFYAQQVEALYSHDIVETVAQIVACEVTAANVWPLSFSDRPVSNGKARSNARKVMPSDT